MGNIAHAGPGPGAHAGGGPGGPASLPEGSTAARGDGRAKSGPWRGDGTRGEGGGVGATRREPPGLAGGGAAVSMVNRHESNWSRWVHRLTPAGVSEGVPARVDSQGGNGRQEAVRGPLGGQVVVLTDATAR